MDFDESQQIDTEAATQLIGDETAYGGEREKSVFDNRTRSLVDLHGLQAV